MPIRYDLMHFHYFIPSKVGTTGDTGSAAIEAVRGSKNIDILALYPKGRISQIQESHMRSILDPNVHLYEVEGTSDELDVPIKENFPGPGIACVNAINWARIMVQVSAIS
jgi:threonine synthase